MKNFPHLLFSEETLDTNGQIRIYYANTWTKISDNKKMSEINPLYHCLSESILDMQFIWTWPPRETLA